MNDPISFDNTEIAFAYKSKSELQKAHFLFAMMGKPWVVKMGTRLAPWSIKAGLPVKGIIRNTIFGQFVGGETLEETIPVAKMLGNYGVQVILDYGVEGAAGEEAYDHSRDEFIRVINFAATQPNVPFMSVKLTGFSRFGLLERLDSLMHEAPEDSLIKKYNRALMLLSASEVNEWQHVQDRFRKICQAAAAAKIGFLVDVIVLVHGRLFCSGRLGEMTLFWCMAVYLV